MELWGDKKVLKGMFDSLAKRGIKFANPFSYVDLEPIMGNKSQIYCHATGIVDETIKKAIAKILFNYVAFNIGEESVLDERWNQARDYIRKGKDSLPIDVSTGVFWEDLETKNLRLLPNGISIRIENNKKGNLSGFIQMFRLMIYEIELSKGYLPESSLIGHQFTPGEEPIELRPQKIHSPIYIPKYEVDLQGRVRIKIRRYGPN